MSDQTKGQRCSCGANPDEGHLITCPQSPANSPSNQRLIELVDALEAAAEANGHMMGPQHLQAHRRAREAFDTYVASLPDEAVCAHPIEHLFYHGFVSGNLGDFRCNLCEAVINRKELDPREVAAQRVERSARCSAGKPFPECSRAAINTALTYLTADPPMIESAIERLGEAQSSSEEPPDAQNR